MTRRHLILGGATPVCALLAWATLAMPAASAQEARQTAVKPVTYPIVVSDHQVLKSAGFMVHSFAGDDPPIKHFDNKCYAYGDGGYGLSISDAVLARFKKRGFSLNSLCMAMHSGIRFDPGTGKRLPIFVFADLAKWKTLDKAFAEGAFLGAFPLNVPDCFKRGLPYGDCTMSFDPISGKRHTAKRRDAYKALHAKIERDVGNYKAVGSWSKPCAPRPPGISWKNEGQAKKYLDCTLEKDERGWLALEKWPTKDDGTPGPNSTIRRYGMGNNDWQHQKFIDVSAKFPKGFGYALYAEGDAGAEPEAELLEAAQTGTREGTESDLRRAMEQPADE